MPTLNAKPIDDEPDKAADPGVPADVIQAPGIIKDSFSNKTWTLPSDALSDAGLATYRSPRDFKKDPNFHYQVCRIEDELNEYIGQDFVPVTRKELGMSDFVHPGQPSPMDEYYVIDGKDVVIKIPRTLADRRYAANKAICDAAKEGVKRNVVAEDGQNLDMNAGGGAAGPVERKLRSRTTRHEPTRDELA